MLEQVDGYLFGEEKCILCRSKLLWYCKTQKGMADVQDRIKAKLMPIMISQDNPKMRANILFVCPECEALNKLDVKF